MAVVCTFLNEQYELLQEGHHVSDGEQAFAFFMWPLWMALLIVKGVCFVVLSLVFGGSRLIVNLNRYVGPKR